MRQILLVLQQIRSGLLQDTVVLAESWLSWEVLMEADRFGGSCQVITSHSDPEFVFLGTVDHLFMPLL
jgi:hypothetical protein